MIEIGRKNTLKVVRKTNLGLSLDGGNFKDILLLERYVPEGVEVGDDLEVFVCMDSEDRIIATTQTPYAQAGEFAFLKCVDSGSIGAFLDWGLPKDVLVPYKEMQQDMQQGYSYIVKILVGDRNRLIASSKLDMHLSEDTSMFSEGQEVDILVAVVSDMGYKAVVNNHCWGLLFDNEIFQELRMGQRLQAYVKKIREDGKLDIVLQKPGYGPINSIAKDVLEKLEHAGGHLAFTDKSAPDVIYREFGVSKKAFKKAIGTLYKQRLITIDPDGLRKN